MNQLDSTCEAIGMTDKQAKRDELLTRIDELDRMTEHTNDPTILQYIAERKKALRDRLETL